LGALDNLLINYVAALSSKVATDGHLTIMLAMHYVVAAPGGGVMVGQMSRLDYVGKNSPE